MNAPTLDLHTESLIRSVVSAILQPAQKGECKCHWLDPARTPILAWKSTKDPNTLVLKISTQKLIGLLRTDKNGLGYWKFREFGEVPSEPTPAPKPTTPTGPSLDLPAAESSTENGVSVPPAVKVEESEGVKKFREKFGEFSASKPSLPDGEQSSTAK